MARPPTTTDRRSPLDERIGRTPAPDSLRRPLRRAVRSHEPVCATETLASLSGNLAAASAVRRVQLWRARTQPDPPGTAVDELARIHRRRRTAVSRLAAGPRAVELRDYGGPRTRGASLALMTDPPPRLRVGRPSLSAPRHPPCPRLPDRPHRLDNRAPVTADERASPG